MNLITNKQKLSKFPQDVQKSYFLRRHCFLNYVVAITRMLLLFTLFLTEREESEVTDSGGWDHGPLLRFTLVLRSLQIGLSRERGSAGIRGSSAVLHNVSHLLSIF